MIVEFLPYLTVRENDHTLFLICVCRGVSGGRLLCLDGGGIRGLVLIVLLRAVQQSAGDRPIKQLFDFIAGTSTGAILALALAMGKALLAIAAVLQKESIFSLYIGTALLSPSVGMVSVS